PPYAVSRPRDRPVRSGPSRGTERHGQRLPRTPRARPPARQAGGGLHRRRPRAGSRRPRPAVGEPALRGWRRPAQDGGVRDQLARAPTRGADPRGAAVAGPAVRVLRRAGRAAAPAREEARGMFEADGVFPFDLIDAVLADLRDNADGALAKRAAKSDSARA